jgi:hypothetical protein
VEKEIVRLFVLLVLLMIEKIAEVVKQGVLVKKWEV